MLPPKRKARPSFFIHDETFSTHLREATREYKREDEPLRELLGLFPQKIRKGRPLAVVVLDGPDDFETYTKNLCEELGFNYCNVELEYHRFGLSHDNCLREDFLEYDLDEVQDSEFYARACVDVRLGHTYFYFSLQDLMGYDMCWNGSPSRAFLKMGKARKEVDDSRFQIQVTKIYQCNAVMFWPRSRHLEVLLETRLFSEILQTIRRATASLPTTETLSLVNTVLDILSCPALELPSHGYGLRDYDGPVQVLADAALRWKDVSLWNRLVSSGKVDGDVEVLGMELISLAMDVFGWQCMSYSLCKMLMRCPEGVNCGILTDLIHTQYYDYRGAIVMSPNK